MYSCKSECALSVRAQAGAFRQTRDSLLVVVGWNPRCLGSYTATLSTHLVWARTRSLFEETFELRCFQLLHLRGVATLQHPSGWQIHQRPQSRVPFVLSGLSSQTTNTLLADSNRSGSRRSKPSSRSVLIGEHPHPWLLLHSQDTESRHRSNKPEGRCELAPQTIQLSLEYLSCQA